MTVRAQDLLDAADEPAALVEADGSIRHANAAWRRAPCLAGPKTTGLVARLRAALDAGAQTASGAYSAGEGEARRHFRLEARPIAGARACLVRRVETTAERQAAQRRSEVLDESAVGFALALEAGGLGSFDISLASRTIEADRRAREAFDLPFDGDPTCADVEARLVPDDVRRLADALGDAIGGGALDAELRVRAAQGAERLVALRGRLVRRGGEAHVVGVVADITERRQAEADRQREERDRLVIGEMRHRIKNLFTIVGTILNLSIRSHPEAAPYKRAVESRLASLEAAQTRLAESGWRTSDVDEIVARELEPFRERRRPNVIAGCGLALEGRAAEVLAMIVHELATNAAKHGALSDENGFVRVACRHEGETVVLVWSEEGGPTVTPPTHSGFGTTVTQRMPERFLGARVETRWAPEGLSYRLELPAERVLRAC
ncbi:HWE histidine kinase domain-containing protein [Salinarimonas rosea]|uniref:HWE histidine kinase domain-containing protein n=1 Tax=Salinarimonas rosea TaxID=552063 RepID=UPI00041ED194|nr:HWE histidine kinase domain-containing protein [Salinarimonas rosea]